MEETDTKQTKTCPFCGKEVIATAKKCKHCGQWLEKQCPTCGEWINAKAMKCRYCGTWLNKYAREKYEGTPVVPQKSYSAQEVNEAIGYALDEKDEEEDTSSLMNIECAVIVIVAGLIYDWSILQYFLAWAIGYVLLCIHILRVLYCIAVSFVWGIIGYCLSPWIFGDSDWDMLVRLASEDFSDYWWMGLIFFAASLFFHWPAMRSRFNFS